MSNTYAFAGGGTLGPVTPLLAVIEEIKKQDPDSRFIWFGTPNGPERSLVEEQGCVFYALPVARLPRYLSAELFFAPWRIGSAFWQAKDILQREKVDLVGMAGGFTGVPVVVAATTLRIPSWVHQPDVLPLLSNKLVAKLASWFTVSFKETQSLFKVVSECVGNPVRSSITKGNKKRAYTRFKLDQSKKTLLVFGGGGGAMWLNQQIKEALPKLCPAYNVLHVAGSNQGVQMPNQAGYTMRELLNEEEMADAWSIADVAVIRGGMGSLTEMSATNTLGIVVPLPGSQTTNAKIFEKASEAILFDQKDASSESFLQVLLDVLKNPDKYCAKQKNAEHILQTGNAFMIAKKLKSLIKNSSTI